MLRINLIYSMFKKISFDVKYFLFYVYIQLSLFRIQHHQPECKKFVDEHFGDKVRFMCPRNMRKSQIFFSASICSSDVVETLRSKDPIKVCATKLR